MNGLVTAREQSCDGQEILGPAPGPQVEGIEHNTKQVRWNEAQLRCSQPDDANDQAIDRRQYPALPASSSNQNRGQNCEHTRQAVKPQHERQQL